MCLFTHQWQLIIKFTFKSEIKRLKPPYAFYGQYIDVITTRTIQGFFSLSLMLFHAVMQKYADSSFVIGGSDTGIRYMMTACPFPRKKKTGKNHPPWIETQVKYLMKLLICLFWTCILSNTVLPPGLTSEKVCDGSWSDWWAWAQCGNLASFLFRARTEVPACPSVYLPFWGQGLGSTWWQVFSSCLSWLYNFLNITFYWLCNATLQPRQRQSVSWGLRVEFGTFFPHCKEPALLIIMLKNKVNLCILLIFHNLMLPHKILFSQASNFFSWQASKISLIFHFHQSPW